MEKTIGFIGCGNMGKGMIKNLLKAGNKVKVFDVNEEAMRALVADGAVPTKSVKECAQGAEVVMLSLPSPEAVEKSIMGPEGVLEVLQPGSYIIDLSTIDPDTTKRIHSAAAAKGVKTLDTPVSGGPHGAAAATLSVMVGGDREDFEAVKEILSIIGDPKKIVYCGPIGSGQVVKICNNMASAIQTVALAETLVVGVKAGVDLKVLVDSFRSSSANCYTLEDRFPKTVFRDNYESPIFALYLMHKDLGLYMATAKSLKVPSAVAALVYEYHTVAMNHGKDKMDCTVICKQFEEIANSRIGKIAD